MSRKNLRTQLEELRQEKEQLEIDNEAARKNEADLTAELERLREENERLLTEKREATEADGRDRGETERLLDEQRQLHEDIQTELAEAVEIGNSLEDRCSSLEDRLLQALEEGELERLKAVEAVRAKLEDALLQQVQELQRQVAKLQSPTSDGSAPANHDDPSKETTEKSTNQSTSKVEVVVVVTRPRQATPVWLREPPQSNPAPQATVQSSQLHFLHSSCHHSRSLVETATTNRSRSGSHNSNW